MSWLIVSADPDLRCYLRDCLESLSTGAEILEATDGVEALGRIQSTAVELVIADLGQPRMNGLQLARALVGSPVSVLLLSAELDPEEAAAAGVLSLPFTRRRLGRRVAELAVAGRAPSKPRPRPTPAAG